MSRYTIAVNNLVVFLSLFVYTYKKLNIDYLKTMFCWLDHSASQPSMYASP